jgi:hypothetical protein
MTRADIENRKTSDIQIVSHSLSYYYKYLALLHEASETMELTKNPF